MLADEASRSCVNVASQESLYRDMVSLGISFGEDGPVGEMRTKPVSNDVPGASISSRHRELPYDAARSLTPKGGTEYQAAISTTKLTQALCVPAC